MRNKDAGVEGQPRGALVRSEIVLYQTDDGRAQVEVRLDKETVWLSLNQMADLFQRDKSVISRHIQNIFAEGELAEDRVVAEYATTARDGKTYQVEYLNLDVIIAVGYRVKSQRGQVFTLAVRLESGRLREQVEAKAEVERPFFVLSSLVLGRLGP